MCALCPPQDGHTALHVAVSAGQDLVVEALLGHGAQVQFKAGPVRLEFSTDINQFLYADDDTARWTQHTCCFAILHLYYAYMLTSIVYVKGVLKRVFFLHF